MAKIDMDSLCPCDSGLLYRNCHISSLRKTEKPIIDTMVKLNVIPEPPYQTRTVFIRDGEGSIIFSANHSSIAMVCGECEAHLTEGLQPETVSNIVMKCNICGAFNDT